MYTQKYSDTEEILGTKNVKTMRSSTIYIFPDTNLFLECKELRELDWSCFNEFDELHLIVTQPVLREIDRLKGKGNERAGRRARKASALFRDFVDDVETHKIIRNQTPCVKLFVRPQYKFCDTLDDKLNYDERDDQLIGTLYQFLKDNPKQNAILLTHDTTPLLTAKSLGLEIFRIPDVWLLPPEKSKYERELAKLKAENERLKATEPVVRFDHVVEDLGEAGRYEDTYTWFDPLTDEEVNSLLNELKTAFPMQTDFERAISPDHGPGAGGLHILGMQHEFIPATDEEIESYQKVDYPQWMSSCESFLRNIHNEMQKCRNTMFLDFSLVNAGTRPAEDVLITIEARGNFEILPVDDMNFEHLKAQKSKESDTLRLPNPPEPPRGRWQVKHPSAIADALQSAQRINRMFARSPVMTGSLREHNANSLDPLKLLSAPIHRDPNAFYYKSERPKKPQKSFRLECDQWRHDDDKECFLIEIHMPNDLRTIEGTIECRVQAANLSQSQRKQIPVRIAVEHKSAFDDARRLVGDLLSGDNSSVASA